MNLNRKINEMMNMKINIKDLFEDEHYDEYIQRLDNIKSHHNMQAVKFLQRCSCRRANLPSH